jgi:thiamine pyrophosphokinase
LYGLIFANGDLEDGLAVRAVLSCPVPYLVIAVDGGIRHVQALGLTPNVVIGDMDSADSVALAWAEQHNAEIKQFPTHKDETDLELALLLAAERNCDPIRVMAALGSRLDQTFANIYLLALPALRNRDVRLVSGASTVWLAYPGETTIQGSSGDTVSLIPMAGSASGVITDALEYPLRSETLFFGPARGISNVMLSSEARVRFDDGLLLIVHTIGRA